MPDGSDWEIRRVPLDPEAVEQLRRALEKGKKRWCWYCGKGLREVKKLIESARAPYCCICDECIGLCVEIIEKETHE